MPLPICICCTDPEHKKYFTNAEGLKLLQIMIKNKTFTRKPALRLLDHVLTNDVQNCRRFVNLPGLGTLFGAFMKVAKKKRKGFDELEDDEHLCSIVASLFQHLEGVDQGKLCSRVLGKFVEENLQKVERLMELYEKYLGKVRKSKAHIEAERRRLEEEGEEIDSQDEEDFLLANLDAGLSTLQHIVYIIGTICFASDKIKEKVGQLLTMQGSSFDEVKELLFDYAADYGSNAEEGEAAAREKKMKETLMLLGVDLTAERIEENGEKGSANNTNNTNDTNNNNSYREDV